MAQAGLFEETIKTTDGLPYRAQALSVVAADFDQNGGTDLAAIATNNFATAADIQAVQDTIDSLSTTLNGTLAVLEINDDDAFDSLAALQRQQAEVQRQIDGIETEQRQKRLDEVNDLREQASRTLSIISLGFEGSQNITQFLTENLTLSQRPAPGSVLNLFV